ncbi:hypothetical protein [Pedobacter sp. NJ-S-72]
MAKVLNVTADLIRNFDNGVVVNNNFLFNDQINNPVKEIIDHFKEEVVKRDGEIERLKAELDQLKKPKGDTKIETAESHLRKVGKV